MCADVLCAQCETQYQQRCSHAGSLICLFQLARLLCVLIYCFATPPVGPLLCAHWLLCNTASSVSSCTHAVARGTDLFPMYLTGCLINAHWHTCSDGYQPVEGFSNSNTSCLRHVGMGRQCLFRPRRCCHRKRISWHKSTSLLQ